MNQQRSTSVQMQCACGCGNAIKPGQRWAEPACKARAYRERQRLARQEQIYDLEYRETLAFDEGEEASDQLDTARDELEALKKAYQHLEQAYTSLRDEHRSCVRWPLDRERQPWVGGPYAVLGVRDEAQWCVIEGAYKALVRACHPDRNPGNATAAFRMTEITTAYAEVKKRRGQT